MSLKLNSSGGGSITLQEPSTASNRTLTLPDNNGNLISSADSGTITQGMLASGVAGTGPAFSAYQSSSQTLSSGVVTKLTFTTLEWDTTSGMYASSRFTPTVAGYYQINAAFTVNAVQSVMLAYIYKNGTVYKQSNSNTATVTSQQINAFVYLNGSTDYVEIYGYLVTGQALNAQAFATYFQAAMVRGA